MKVAYKYRGVLWLALLLVVLPWAAVRYALRDTVSAWWEGRRLSAEIARSEDASQAEPTLVLADDLLLDGSLLALLQPVAAEHSVSISDYRPLVTLRAEGLEVHTAVVVLGGAWREVLPVVRYLERQVAPCKLSSLRFTTITPPNRGARRLEATVYVEQIVQK